MLAHERGVTEGARCCGAGRARPRLRPRRADSSDDRARLIAAVIWDNPWMPSSIERRRLRRLRRRCGSGRAGLDAHHRSGRDDVRVRAFAEESREVTRRFGGPMCRVSNSASDVIVIGAGFAGLSAAVRLAAAGRRVLVLARGRLGGRATAFEDRQDQPWRRRRPRVLARCLQRTLPLPRRSRRARSRRAPARLDVAFVDGAGAGKAEVPAAAGLASRRGALLWSGVGWRGSRLPLPGTSAPRWRGAAPPRRYDESPHWLDRLRQTPRSMLSSLVAALDQGINGPRGSILTSLHKMPQEPPATRHSG